MEATCQENNSPVRLPSSDLFLEDSEALLTISEDSSGCMQTNMFLSQKQQHNVASVAFTTLQFLEYDHLVTRK